MAIHKQNENVERVQELIKQDKCVTIHNVCKNCSYRSCHCIISEDL